ncbi:MAG: ABC transporter permease [Thermodesulfovibrionales bacterium]|nr:ABC transporter permease [Thermodesulfovibrionales bacterium]
MIKNLTKIVSQSFKAVWSFKLRTLFCLISIALGISAVTTIVAAVEGAYKRAFEIVARFGPDSLLVFSGGEEARALGLRSKTISIDEVNDVREAFSRAYLVVPMTSARNISISYKERKYQTQVIGSTSDYSRAWSWPVIQGSDFTDEDVKGIRNVGLIGQFLMKELFGNEDPVGKFVFVKGIPVQIVGVLSERGTSPGGDNLDDRIVMPLTTVMRKIINETKYVTAFRARFIDQENLYNHAEELRIFLRLKHNLPVTEPDDFRIVTPKEIVKFLVALTGSLVTFLGITGVMSLIVAGFVLTNLFLLSVKERTSEIGIRRAIGAKKRDILIQFIGEAVIITTVGGVFGFALSLLSSNLLSYIAEFPLYFSWKAFTTGFALSWIIGIVFGLQPARRAANLNPIEAIKG